MNNKFLIKRTLQLLLLVLAITSTSCKKFLETKQYDQSNEAAFYKTASDFDQALIGTYSALTGPYNFFYQYTDIRSDNTSVFVPGGAQGPLSKSEYDDFTLTENNEHLAGLWDPTYSLIQKANDILTFIVDADIPQASKDQYTGEAKVLRAIAYYNLVRFFGGVPLVLKRFENIDDSYKEGRSSVDEVYTQIITDLTDASNLLTTFRNTGANAGRADKGIALSLLGDVYLTRQQFGEAAVEFKKVIDSHEYSLVGNYLDLFSSGQQGNSETIWQAYFLAGLAGSGSSFPNYFAPINSDSVLLDQGQPFGWNQPTQDIADAYEPNDVRRQAISDGFTRNGSYYAYKYLNTYVDIASGTGDGKSGKDWYIMRYADVLLKYAEAVNEAEGPTNAYASVDEVRDRANLDPLPAGLNKDQFREAVYQEERLESPFEGHRWFDLIRTGRAVSVMNSKIQPLGDVNCVGVATPITENELLLPIPAVVRAIAPNLTQNPGY